MRFRSLFLTFAAISLLQGVLSAAYADSTTVTERTVSGVGKDFASALGEEFQKPLSVAVTYIKGDRSRVESGDKIVLHGIAGSGTITVLDPATRTYYVTTEAEELNRNMPLGKAEDAEMMKSVNYSTHPIAGARTIMGLKASGVQSKFSIDLKIPDPDSKQTFALHVLVDEEDWISDKVPEAPSDLSPEDAKLYLDSAFGSGFLSMLKHSVSAKDVDSVPDGAALTSTTVFRIVLPDNTPAEIKEQTPPAFTVREDILSISRDRLADELFTVPADYQKVLAPVRPATEAAKPAVAVVAPSAK